jgi:transcriptional antiterminator RfaH
MSAHWYALRCKPHKEAVVAGQLGFNQIEFFYPTLRVRPVNPRSQKAKPYFPGYLFVRTDLERTGSSILNWMSGSMGLIDFGGQPASVPEHLIKALCRREEKINRAGGELPDGLKAGDLVAVRDGPLAGYQAIFDFRLPGSQRIKVLLKLLGGQFPRVELPAGFIQLIKQF